ncbi:MAG: hypothetical protein IJR82_03480 [Bacilli bacterium]|nr:hypothetical protein [Bacilli bacterium]
MVTREKCQQDIDTLRNYYNSMNKINYLSILKKVYTFMKEIAPNYYSNNGMIDEYKWIFREFLKCEQKYSNELVINPTVRFGNLHQDNPIEYLVYEARKNILKRHAFIYGDDTKNRQQLQALDLANKCMECSEFIKITNAKRTQLKFGYLLIYPAYKEGCQILGGGGHHCACIVTYGSDEYLIDVTYSQFFFQNNNCLERLGVMNVGGCKPGVYMLMTEKGEKIANKLIRDGYVKLNEETLKLYLDSFTISFRNGLYYERTKDFSYTTDYTVDDYLDFLWGNDNLLNYEGRDYLGFQKRPLKDANTSFRKRS